MKYLCHKYVLLLTVTLALPFWGVGGGTVMAQGQDPILAAMILLYTDKAKNELKQQEEMMLLESTGHIWITEEVNATTDLQKEFNNYLDSFHGIIMYAAQIYGFYHEIDHLIGNLGAFSDQLSAHPSNADIKMTEKERMEVIFGIRPKLKLMNKKLQRLTKAVKYTSLGDVWAEIDYNARTGADKKNIVEQSMLRWKRAAKQ